MNKSFLLTFKSIKTFLFLTKSRLNFRALLLSLGVLSVLICVNLAFAGFFVVVFLFSVKLSAFILV